MKILSIGNSFSQDAQRYLRKIADGEGVSIKAVNLYIGGCTLRTHYINMLDDNRNYDFEYCGEKTGLKVSIREALASDNWDVITLQQGSPLSPKIDTFIPYIEELAKYARKYCPKAKIYIHETWFYEDGCDRLKNIGYELGADMFREVHENYKKAAELIGADGIIPCGSAMMKAYERGVAIHRDTFHASYGVGRYILALTWFKTLTGKGISENRFNGFDVPISDSEREEAIRAVEAATASLTMKG